MEVRSFFLSILVLFASSLLCQENELYVNLHDQDKHNYLESEALHILIGILPGSDNELLKVSQTIKKCLERTEQFKVKIERFNRPTKKSEVKAHFDKGFAWVLFLNDTEDKKNLEWRIYDPIDAIMLKGKKIEKEGTLVRGWGYAVADQVWPELMQTQSCFSSKIAYIKRAKNKLGKSCSIISLCDYDGSHIQDFLNNTGIYVGTYWHINQTRPYLFCSEFTRFNVRLISLTMNKKKNVVLNVDGTCVGISLSKNKSEAIYCRSGDIWHYGYNSKYKKGLHTRLIKNDGKNTNPILLSSGDIIFCSDAQSLKKRGAKVTGPKICYYHKNTKEIEVITTDGYCVGPAYSAETNQLVYSKRVNSIMQLFLYDMKTKKHEQLTFDSGSKFDASWSPCGSCIAFCYQRDQGSRIAIIDINLKKRWYITKANDDCCYPAWSPCTRPFINIL